MMKPSLAEVERTLATLYDPNQVLELRLYGDGAGKEKVIPQVGWFDNHQLLAETIVKNEVYPACCKISLNPIKPEFLEGKPLNELRTWEKNMCASDEWIASVRWLLIDNDGPPRSEVVSATTDEKALAADATYKLVDELKHQLGWSPDSFLIADSGNGYHVLLRVDLPAEGSKPLMQRVVKAAQVLAGDKVIIDPKTAYPSRPIKPYGVISHKGTNCLERPWRRTNLIGACVNVAPASLESLKKLAALAPEAKIKGVHTGPWTQDVMMDYLKWSGWKCGDPKEYEAGLKWVGPCVQNSEHRDTAIILVNGWPSYVCPHKKSHPELSFEKFKAHFERVKQSVYPYPTRNYGFNDKGNGERFADMHHGDLVFCDPLGGWFRYEEGVFKFDETQQVMIRAHDVIRSMHEHAKTLRNEEARESLAKHAHHSSQDNKLRAMLRQAEALMSIEHSQFDSSTLLFNCSNGTIDLQAMEFRPHRREDFLTKKTGIPYDPRATYERWSKFMVDITQGNADVARYLQKAVGYTLTGRVLEHVLFILYGTGANGKSTFKEILLNLFGDYAFSLPNNSLMVSGNINPEGASPVLASMRGARFCVATEPSAEGRLNEALIKIATGDDEITCRQLYKSPFSYPPQFSLWLLTNARPRVHGTDHGLWRRVKMIGFNARFEGANEDKRMKDKLRAELPGILNWALEGLWLYNAEGLTEPKCVQDLTKEYRGENDQVGQFTDQCVLQDGALPANRSVGQTELYQRYKEWALQSGENYVLNARQLRSELQAREWREGRDRVRDRVWLGRTLGKRDSGLRLQDPAGDNRQSEF
jgi:putative DNA primase/helicase